VTAVDIAARDDGTVKDRLIRAADAEIAERGIAAVQMESIAKSAGVSRATAFRQLGSVSELLVQVALLRARRHVAEVQALMAGKAGAFAKLEAAMVYTTRELPTDPSISALIARHSASVHDPYVHQVAVDAVGYVLKEGQRNGEVRDDLEIDELVDFLVEQTYVAAEELDRSADEVRRRFRHFIIPALAASGAPGGERLSRTREVEESVDTAIEALRNLADQLKRGRPQ
jgi:AcrR family transcriptional regulator